MVVEGGSGFLDIREGQIEVGSLQGAGLGVDGVVDVAAMQPLDSWLRRIDE